MKVGDLVKKKKLWKCVEYSPQIDDTDGSIGLVIGRKEGYIAVQFGAITEFLLGTYLEVISESG